MWNNSNFQWYEVKSEGGDDFTYLMSMRIAGYILIDLTLITIYGKNKEHLNS